MVLWSLKPAPDRLTVSFVILSDSPDVIELVGEYKDGGFLRKGFQHPNGMFLPVLPRISFVRFRSGFNKIRYIPSKNLLYLIECHRRILDRVMEDACDYSVFGTAIFDEDLGDIERMNDIGNLRPFSVLPAVCSRSEFNGFENHS